jgi:hypothetical protein
MVGMVPLFADRSKGSLFQTTVFELTEPGTFSDPLTEVLRNGVDNGRRTAL